MGANSSGQLGVGASAATVERSIHSSSSSSWRATKVQGLQTARVFMVAAGGEQSFALGLGSGAAATATAATATTKTTTATAVPTAAATPGLPLEENTLDLIRKFSVIKPATSFLTTSQLLSLIEQAATTHHTDFLERTLFDIFSSPSLLNGSFLSVAHSSSSTATSSTSRSSSSTFSSLDVQGLESIYVAVMKLNHTPLLSRLMYAFSTALDHFLPVAKSLSDVDSLRCLLAYWQCPLNSNTSLSKDTVLKLCEAIVSLPSAGRVQLFAWARADYPPHLFATRLLRPLHSHLEYHLKVNFGKGRSVPMLAVIMNYLYAANERIGEDGRKIDDLEEEGREGGGRLIPAEQFANAAVSALSVESLLHDLGTWKALKEENKNNMNKNVFAFCRFPFLLSAEAKQRLLHGEAALGQQQAAQRDFMRQMFSGGPVSPFLVLRVDRARLLESTLAQIGVCDPMMLKKQLKVSFVGEEGVDEGGVKKEFFQLLCAQLFDFTYGMFRGTESGREVWFSPSRGPSFGSDDSQEYQLVGVLVGLAIYNSVLLDLNFPLVAYKKLLGLPVGFSDLKELDAEMGEGLRKLLEWKEEGGGEGGSGGGKVEDVFGLCFEVDWVEFGEVRRHELIEGGREVEVTAANRRDYVRLYVEWVLDGSIRKSFEEFKSGFDRVMGGSSISLLKPEELMLLVCGTPHLNLRELEAVARYEGGYEKSSNVIQWFWAVIHEMDLTSQRQLLMFVTGSAKAPIGGLGKLSLLIQRAGPDSDHLPTAHTCFNALLMPEYGSKEKLKERLMKAISECRGFGLQ
eukprot:evm.model.NODE_51206_length_4267_cov_13.577221.1